VYPTATDGSRCIDGVPVPLAAFNWISGAATARCVCPSLHDDEKKPCSARNRARQGRRGVLAKGCLPACSRQKLRCCYLNCVLPQSWSFACKLRPLRGCCLTQPRTSIVQLHGISVATASKRYHFRATVFNYECVSYFHQRYGSIQRGGRPRMGSMNHRSHGKKFSTGVMGAIGRSEGGY